MRKQKIITYLSISFFSALFVAIVHWISHMIVNNLVGNGILFSGFAIPLVDLIVFLTVFLLAFIGMMIKN